MHRDMLVVIRNVFISDFLAKVDIGFPVEES